LKERGEATVIRRQEREKTGGGRCGGKSQWRSDLASHRQQGLVQARKSVPLGAAANAELDREIGAQPDKQDREGNRDRVQCTDQPQAGSRRHGKAASQSGGDRENEPYPAQCQPEIRLA
jgi:hypothetical protein